jgi:phage terminase Nu1 subunit (DNA packaging protein)
MDVSLKELAAILHLSERRVRQIRDEQGILTPVPGTGGSTKAKKYRLEQCVPEYIDFKIAGAAESGNTIVREKEQAEHERIKKKISEVKLRRLRQELLEAKDVEQFLTEMLVAFRARLVVIPQKLAPLVIAESDVNKIRDLLEGEIFEAIEELSEYDPLKIDTNVPDDESEDEEESEDE